MVGSVVVVKEFRVNGRDVRFTLKARKWYVEIDGKPAGVFTEKKGGYIVSFLEKLTQEN